eukprot:1156292-Pelagomonas_calceolata.AAC.4
MHGVGERQASMCMRWVNKHAHELGEMQASMCLCMRWVRKHVHEMSWKQAHMRCPHEERQVWVELCSVMMLQALVNAGYKGTDGDSCKVACLLAGTLLKKGSDTQRI